MPLCRRSILLLALLVSSSSAFVPQARKGVFVLAARYECPNNLVADVTVGTPPKSMPVDMNIMTEKSGFVDYAHLHFGEYDYRDSSTFNFLGKKFDAVFGSGQWGSDFVRLGKTFPVTKLRFGLITNRTYTTPDFFVTQIIGLGPLWRQHSSDSILTTLSHRVRQKVFSVWVEPKSLNDTRPTKEASITFGDIDHHCYHYGAIFTKHVPAKYDGAGTWGFRLDTIYINHKHYFVMIDVYETAAIATHPYCVVGREDALDQIAHELGAHKDGLFYFVECKRRAKLPDISFNIGSSDIWIGPEDYVIVDDEHDVPLCTLNFVLAEDRNSTTNSKWSFGIPILNRYCPLFDFGKNRVGFSQIKKDASLNETHPRARYLSTFDDTPH